MPFLTIYGRRSLRSRARVARWSSPERVGQAARKELAESIFDETERLNRLVANLLDMTRLEGGAMTVKKDWHSLEEIVGVVLNRFARQLAEHRVETHLDPNLPLVPMDDLLIQQVLMNLLENAFPIRTQGNDHCKSWPTPTRVK